MIRQPQIWGVDENDDWNVTQSLDTLAAYRRFLASYPSGIFTAHAHLRKHALLEEKAWLLAEQKGKIYGYEAYLDDYPNGKYARLAGDRLDILEEKLAWESACNKHTISGYFSYKQSYPDGKYVDNAILQINQLVKKKPNTFEEVQSLTREEKALNKATKSDTLDRYKVFMQKFPESGYIQEVAHRIEQLKAESAQAKLVAISESDWWEYTLEKNTLRAYREYVRKFPNGQFLVLAKEKIKTKEERIKAHVSPVSQKHIVIPKNLPPAIPFTSKVADIQLVADKKIRNRSGIKLAWLWLSGFGILYILEEFFSPEFLILNSILGIILGVFFIFQRGVHLTRGESRLYLIGLASSLIIMIHQLLFIWTHLPVLSWMIGLAISFGSVLIIKPYLDSRVHRKK